MPTAVWKGYIGFGLVTFPVRLFTAARAETIHFHMLHKKDLSRVKEVWYCAEEDKPIERSEIVKGYEAQKEETSRFRTRRSRKLRRLRRRQWKYCNLSRVRTSIRCFSRSPTMLRPKRRSASRTPCSW